MGVIVELWLYSVVKATVHLGKSLIHLALSAFFRRVDFLSYFRTNILSLFFYKASRFLECVVFLFHTYHYTMRSNGPLWKSHKYLGRMFVMDILHLEKGLGECVLRASGALRRGGVVLYPTDTLYGLGADALSDTAVAKVYAIKDRDTRKPIHCIVSDLEMAAEYAEVNNLAKRLAEEFLPGPLTLILKKRAGVHFGIARGIDTFGIRIPDNEFCLELAKSFGKPYTTTSANKADMQTEPSIEKIVKQLGAGAEIIHLVVDAGILPLRSPSTVVNVVSGSPSVLREGAIPASEIMRFA